MLLLRPSRPADLPAIAAIYAHHVVHGTGSFELDPPDVAEMTRRRQDVLHKGLPHWVALRQGELIGFAYANHFRPRPAYRFMAENSVYTAPSAMGQGVGKALMAELLRQCEQCGVRQMLAVIGDSNNLGSVGLHAALGFVAVGTIKNSGWKHGRWLDTVLMQRALGLGDSQPPTLDAPAAG